MGVLNIAPRSRHGVASASLTPSVAPRGGSWKHVATTIVATTSRAPATIVLALLAALNSQLAFSLPPWPEDKSPWRYLLRCRSSSLQDLSSSGTLLY